MQWGGYHLSVIIPTYNRASIVVEAIESVLTQKTKYSYEIIVINDGSIDNTKEVLNQYKSEEHVKIINQQNKGFAGSRNTGISTAYGDYLMFVDDDDRLIPGAIEALLSCAFEYDADVVEGTFINRYPDGSHEKGNIHEKCKVNPMQSFNGYFWGKVYKRICFSGLKIPEGYWYEDSLNAQIMWKICKSCYTIETCVYEYFKNDKGITVLGRSNPKSIDSFYITRQLLKDRKYKGLSFEQEDYEYFLRMVALTYHRTRRQNDKVKQSLFVLWVKLRNCYYKDFYTEKEGYLKGIEQALREKNYRLYLLKCEVNL